MIEIKTVFADNVDDVLRKTDKLNDQMYSKYAYDTEFELVKSHIDIHKISDSKVLYCNVLVYEVGDADAEL